MNAIQLEFNFLYRWHQFIQDSTNIVKKLLDVEGESEVYDVEEYEYDELAFPDVDGEVMHRIRGAAKTTKR